MRFKHCGHAQCYFRRVRDEHDDIDGDLETDEMKNMVIPTCHATQRQPTYTENSSSADEESFWNYEQKSLKININVSLWSRNASGQISFRQGREKHQVSIFPQTESMASQLVFCNGLHAFKPYCKVGCRKQICSMTTLLTRKHLQVVFTILPQWLSTWRWV